MQLAEGQASAGGHSSGSGKESPTAPIRKAVAEHGGTAVHGGETLWGGGLWGGGLCVCVCRGLRRTMMMPIVKVSTGPILPASPSQRIASAYAVPPRSPAAVITACDLSDMCLCVCWVQLKPAVSPRTVMPRPMKVIEVTMTISQGSQFSHSDRTTYSSRQRRRRPSHSPPPAPEARPNSHHHGMRPPNRRGCRGAACWRLHPTSIPR